MDTLREYIPPTKVREKQIIIVVALFITGLIAFFFYRSIYGLVTFPITLFFVGRYLRQEFEARRKSRALGEFKEMLSSISSSLKAGHSMENAIIDLEKDFNQMYAGESMLQDGILQMIQRLRLHVPCEKAMEEFVSEYGYEEMVNFAFMISFAKRLGGNYVRNVAEAANKLQQQLEIKQEVEATVAEKKLELRIMIAMPIAILIYIGTASYDFIKPLYGNIMGVVVMTLALVVYVFCIGLGRRIIRFEY